MASPIKSDVCDDHSNATNQTSYSFQEEESAPGIQFCPPLYLQRYMLAVDYLTKNSIQTVIDFGCAECGFFRLLSTVPSLKEISLVDIDRNLLMTKTRVISPELKDYVHRRSDPLNVFLFAGSAADYDVRMKDYQTVTLIEVIEHLYPDVLESVTSNVFGAIHPLHVIVTTPNSEFNVLFGNDDPEAFRHWDHKFEWTRKQFQDWCHQVCKSYGYEVEYSGVGFRSSTKKSSELGPCSQAAFFKQREQEVKGTESSSHSECRNVYELIAESQFPYEENKMSVEERLDLEIMYALRQIAFLKVELEDKSDDENCGKFCIKVSHIANRNNIKHLASLQEVREYLKQKSFDISDDGERVTLNMSQFIDPSSSEDDDDDENNFDDCLCNCDANLNDEEENKCYCGQCSANRVVKSGDVEELWDTESEDTAVK